VLLIVPFDDDDLLNLNVLLLCEMLQRHLTKSGINNKRKKHTTMDILEKPQVKGGIVVGVASGTLLFLIAGLLTIILVLASIKTVPYSHYGLRYDRLTGLVDDTKVYMPGRYVILLNRKFILYPSTFETCAFSVSNLTPFVIDSTSLTTRTKDGLSVRLDVIVQYQIRKEDLLALHYSFGVDYKQVYLNEIKSEIFDVVGEYNAVDLQRKRMQFSQEVKQRLQVRFDTLYSNIVNVMIGNIRVSSQFESSIEDKLSMQQEVLRSQIQRDTDLIHKDIEVYSASADSKIQVINANRDATIQLIQESTAANITNIETTSYSTAYTDISSRLSLIPNKLLQYLWYTTIRDATNVSLVVNLADTFATSANTTQG
jgi:regulator of protease activity HflC (stomatin/prohibitin superfamily)